MAIVKAESVRKTEDAPPIYQEYVRKEKEWLGEKIKHTSSIIDVGCGEGRVTPFLSVLTDSYLGVDLDSKAISKAKELENERIKFKILDVTELSKHFPANSFETSVCLWNTIGNIDDDEKAIREMYNVTSKECFITSLKKGNLKERINYYESHGLEYKLDKEGEIFYSEAWGIARAYDLEDFKKMCENAGFKIAEVVDLGKIGFGMKLIK